MQIVLGLGNIGKKFENNRHNVGFMVLDKLALKEGLSFVEKPVFHSQMTNFGDLILAKPTTFMNESGLSAKALLNQFKGNLTVVYDDITIPIGMLKCSLGKGDGGHNGISSIINQLGTKDFFRIRIGIRPIKEELLKKIAPPDGFEKFMLTNFTPLETDHLNQGIEKGMSIIESLPFKSIDQIMNENN